MQTVSVSALFDRAAELDAPAAVTGAAVDLMQRIARQQAWDLWHADPRRPPFHVDETATIRGRAVSFRLFVSRHGATYRRLWRVDGRGWRAVDVLQAFGQ